MSQLYIKRKKYKKEKPWFTDKLYFISDVGTVGIYYQESKQKLTVGGNKRFFHIINSLVQEYFGCVRSAAIETASNKIKVITGCNIAKYHRGLKKIRKDDMTLQPTKRFNRIWW